MAAILIAILDFVHFLVLEFVDNHFNIFPVPWNICLDTLFVLLAGLYTNLWQKWENGGHFGHHLGFYTHVSFETSRLSFCQILCILKHMFRHLIHVSNTSGGKVMI